MLIEMKPLSSIRPYEQNPRLNDAAVKAVESGGGSANNGS